MLLFAAIARRAAALDTQDRSPLIGLGSKRPPWRITMSRYLAALSLALSVAASAAPVRAQDTDVKDAATARCIDMAQTQYPQGPTENQGGRVATYKACMDAAGSHP
jgi:uncharacterized membrane protein